MSDARAMKNWWPIYLLGAGVVLLVGSVVFAALVVGIPGPDDSPAETARQARLGNVAFIGFISGVLMSFSGLIFGLIRVVRSTKRIRRALAAVQDVDPSEKVDEG